MSAEEGDGGRKFVGGCGGDHGGEERVRNAWCQDEVDGHEDRGEEVCRRHHLRAREAAVTGWGFEDVVLNCIGEAVEEEIDPEEGEAVDRGGLFGRAGFAGLGRVVEGEEGDASRDSEDNEVFREWIALAEERDM